MTRDTQELLYGRDATEGIVAVELHGGASVDVYRRQPSGATSVERAPFSPWLLTTETGAELIGARADAVRLDGDFPLAVRLNFRTWRDYLEARDQLGERGIPLHRLGSPVDQYLAATGRTLFKGMQFDDLTRLQIDIETTSLEAAGERSQII